MGKYSEKVFTQKSHESKPGKYSSMIFKGPEPGTKHIEDPYNRDTNEISTITNKPIQEPSDNDWYKPAKFRTLLQAGFVDSDKGKIDLFSKARGISPDRYKVEGNKIWFKGDDGNFYPETPKKVDKLLTKLVAELPSEGLADIGAAGGLVFGGVPGAMVGAGAGELVRKEIGRIFFGDKQNVPDYLIDMAVQAFMGGLDAKIAKSLTGSLSSKKIKKQTGGKISDNFTEVVGDLSPEQRAGGQLIKQKADNINVDILPHQAMDDPTLTGYYKLLRDNPQTAQQVRLKDDNLDKQVQTAGEDLINSISNQETDPFEVGQELADAGLAAIEKMKMVRSNAVKPLYDAANNVTDVNVMPALEEIARLKKRVKPGMKAHSALNRIERMLLNKNDDIGPRKTPESQLEILDNVKQEVDAILNGKDSSAISNKLKRKMKGLKDILTTQTDEKSREYQVGRALFSASSPKITKAEKGILGTLARMQTDESKEKAVKKVFSSPRSIRLAKKAVEKTNPELWPDVVAELFRSEFEKAGKIAQGSGGKVLNRPGKYTARMWDLSNRKKIKIATEGMEDANGNPLYDQIVDFFDVMQKASIGQGKESATQSRLKMEKDLQGLPGKLTSSMMNLRQAMVNFGLGTTQDRAFDKNAKKLLQLMQTPEGVNLIAQAQGYGPATEKGMIAATTLLLMAMETNAGKGIEIIQTYREK